MATLLGSFEVISGKIIISDPCYKLYENELSENELNELNELNEKKLPNKIVDVPNGTWNAYISKHNNSNDVSELLIRHNSITLKDTYNIS